MKFLQRHVGNFYNIDKMLKICGVQSLNELIDKTNINYNFTKPNINNISEIKAQNNLKNIINKNENHTSFLGLGYYNNNTPFPIKRHLIENAQWYTAYTPYQAEISQGRLESQYNFQSVIKELTDLPLSNASLLDESSVAGEALNLSYSYYKKKKSKFIVADDIHPQTLHLLETRSKILNLDMNIVNFSNKDINSLLDEIDYNDLCNIIFQYPNTYGDINIPNEYIDFAKKNNILTTGITDLLALTKIVTPGELGLNIALGNSQRLGVPLWYGGPHPAFFSVSEELLRYIPGRIIGKSLDSNKDETYRLALQTREQHIKKKNATSNICTSQSLLTNVVSFYCIYNGKKGLLKISDNIKNKINYFIKSLNPNIIINKSYFDTITIKVDNPEKIVKDLEKENLLVRLNKNNSISISFDETIKYKDIDLLIKTLKKSDDEIINSSGDVINIPKKLIRKSDFFNNEIFNKYQTETELLRYMNRLAQKDYTLCNGIIPLGSCTMKLNATYQLEPLLWDKVTNVHPFVPLKYAEGYQELIKKTGNYLKKLTGFNNISFQPNSGATGEYAGLLCIKEYHKNNNKKRNICLIPNSAHGTNFASATIANMEIKTFDDKILENLEEFNNFVSKYENNLACLMITYPNTNGVFIKDIDNINDIIHRNGGLVYMDGANMNALLGLFNPYKSGFDVCHLNLHKTFCIPHGGGGPGLGPILCNDKLAKYLPNNIIQNSSNELSCGSVAASNWSSASLLTIPYLYISSMGIDGLTNATKMAILHSNYLKNSLKDFYLIKDVNENEVVGHEFIIDVSEFKNINITENDIAKRLIDYSFHPPTMSWPRTGVLMFEPTESESIEELDRLIIAMKSIRKEISDIKEGKYSQDNNLLKNAPHNFKMIKNWDRPYNMEEAFYPVKNLNNFKFNVPNGRIDDLYGDRLLLKKNKV